MLMEEWETRGWPRKARAMNDKLKKIREFVKTEMIRITSDERYHYPSALVDVNAPLALEQTCMGAKMEILQKLKVILEHQ